MVALITLTIILFTSVLIIKIASKILVLTGLSEEVARFQAKSALTGTGFTTSESESLITHPLRRRVVSFLMTISSVGIISVISTSVLSFVNVGSTAEGMGRFIAALFLFAGILIVSKNKKLDNWINKKLKQFLGQYSSFELADYANLLHLGDKFGIGEVYVAQDHWFEGKTIKILSLPKEGLIILGIQTPRGEFLGLPSKEYTITHGDTLVLYGRADMLSEIGHRKKDEGDAERQEAVEKLQEIKKEEKEREEVIVENRDETLVPPSNDSP